ncbi:MAG: rod shape-determining protein MreD [Aquificae bacterium]|nr:rod shape-determining protein MreD [Aquificota bacterium]
MKAYLVGFIILLFQMSTLAHLFTVNYITPDFLSIFVILYSLNNPLHKSLKLAGFLGFMQDLFSPTVFLFNFITKILIVFTTIFFKERFFYSTFLVKGLLVAVVSFIDIVIKTTVVYIKTGFFEFSTQNFVYIGLNFAIFYMVSLINELRQS